MTILHFRKKYSLGVTLRARALTTIPDNTSQKFILLGQLSRADSAGGRQAVVFLDFANTRTRECTDNDFEKWYARGDLDTNCMMGHKVRFVNPEK